MKKYIIKGKIRNKRIQYTRYGRERAIGIAENFNSATIYSVEKNGLIPTYRCKNGICKEVDIKIQLNKARELVK